MLVNRRPPSDTADIKEDLAILEESRGTSELKALLRSNHLNRCADHSFGNKQKDYWRKMKSTKRSISLYWVACLLRYKYEESYSLITFIQPGTFTITMYRITPRLLFHLQKLIYFLLAVYFYALYFIAPSILQTLIIHTHRFPFQFLQSIHLRLVTPWVRQKRLR